jgi:hypothetical protein
MWIITVSHNCVCALDCLMQHVSFNKTVVVVVVVVVMVMMMASC